MGSRRRTEGEGARLPALSRRAVLAGTSAAALAVPSRAAAAPAVAHAAATDGGANAYRQWLFLTAKIERLQTRWAKLESWLAREHKWLQLSPAEQQALPWARELRDIDGCLDVLFEQREALLQRLPTVGCSSLEAVAVKLGVVERLVARDDHPEAHAMVAGARQDLLAFVRAAELREYPAAAPG
ncbi:MAG: helicase [Caulobacter sp.]|nr:helicase [Caulobacter sp.]